MISIIATPDKTADIRNKGCGAGFSEGVVPLHFLSFRTIIPPIVRMKTSPKRDVYKRQPFDGFHSLILNFENHSENEQKIQVELWDDAGKNLIFRETVPVGAEDDPLEYVKEFDRIGDSKQK